MLDRLQIVAAELVGDLPADDPSTFTARYARDSLARHASWVAADEQRSRAQAAWADLFDTVDVVLMPVSQTQAFLHDTERRYADRTVAVDRGPDEPAERAYHELLFWAGLATMPLLPSLAMPIGPVDGLPLGVQIVGPRWSDRRLLAIGSAMAAGTGIGFVLRRSSQADRGAPIRGDRCWCRGLCRCPHPGRRRPRGDGARGRPGASSTDRGRPARPPGSAEAADWWYPDAPKRGRGSGGGSAVNGMVLDAIEPIDLKRWGWDDGPELQRWVLDRWAHTTVVSGPFTEAFGACVTRGFPVAAPTAEGGAPGWRSLSLAAVGGHRVSAADAFLVDDIEVRFDTEVAAIDGTAVVLGDGTRIESRHLFVAAGVVGSPALLVASGLVAAGRVAEPINHPSTAVIVELDPALQTRLGGDRPPSSHLLRVATGLSENTIDLQLLVLDHTGADETGRSHAAVIVTALEPDRQKVLVAGITQVLHWLRELDGAAKVSISDDQTPVQHQCCTLTEVKVPSGNLTVIDSSVLPAAPHANPMLSIAVGARRAVLRHL